MMAGKVFANAPVGAVHALAYPSAGTSTFRTASATRSCSVDAAVQPPAAADAYAELADAIVAPDPTATRAERAAQFIVAIEQLVARMPYPQTLRDAGVPDTALPLLARDAMNVQRLLVNNPREVTFDDALGIYRQRSDVDARHAPQRVRPREPGTDPVVGQRCLRSRQQRHLLQLLRHRREWLADRSRGPRHPWRRRRRLRRRDELFVLQPGRLPGSASRRHPRGEARTVERPLRARRVPRRGRAPRGRGTLRARLRRSHHRSLGADPRATRAALETLVHDSGAPAGPDSADRKAPDTREARA